MTECQPESQPETQSESQSEPSKIELEPSTFEVAEKADDQSKIETQDLNK